MIQSIESMHQEKLEKEKLLGLLNKIANSADGGIYYQSSYSANDMKEKLNGIKKMIKDAGY